MDVVAGATIGGKYRLVRPVSRGGMGSVWAARHVQLGSMVAVKFMDPSYVGSPMFRARFEREARAAAALRSPHVVHVQDYGVDAGVPYIVMELLHGEDLHARLEQRERLTPAETASLLVQVGKALRCAHDTGLVHRDLKPRNIFITRAADDDDEIVKIFDFGIAKETKSRVAGDSTATGEIIGSPHYMSPEQLRAEKDIDARSDLWSLGVILFRCLTGELPFSGDVLTVVMVKILVDPIPHASHVAPDLPPALDSFFARAFARDRTQRFGSVREMVDTFLRIAGAPAASVGLPAPSPSAPVIAPDAGALGPPFAAASPTPMNAEKIPAPSMDTQRSRALWLVGAGGVLVALVVGAFAALPFATRNAISSDSSAGMREEPPALVTAEVPSATIPVPAQTDPTAASLDAGGAEHDVEPSARPPAASPVKGTRIKMDPPSASATSAPLNVEAPKARDPAESQWGF